MRVDESIDYYAILEVSPEARTAVIEKAYRALMMEEHPDRGGDTRRAQLINEAYSVLSSPRLRADYDRLRRSRQSSQRSERREATQGAPVQECSSCGSRTRGRPQFCPACGRALNTDTQTVPQPRAEASKQRTADFHEIVVEWYRRNAEGAAERAENRARTRRERLARLRTALERSHKLILRSLRAAALAGVVVIAVALLGVMGFNWYSIVEVPDVVGTSPAVAQHVIRETGLVPVGSRGPGQLILRTSPEPASKVTRGSSVEMISGSPQTWKASQSIDVPNVVGMTVKDAQDALMQAGLNMSGSRFPIDRRVTSTQPAAGSKILPGQDVEVLAR